MSRRLTFTIAALFVLAGTSSAWAGYMSVDQLDATGSHEATTASTANTPDDNQPLPARPSIERERPRGLANAPSDGGMSGSAGIGGASQAPSPAFIVVPCSTSAQLSARLHLSERVWLPPPFSTGVFRPPRRIG